MAVIALLVIAEPSQAAVPGRPIENAELRLLALQFQEPLLPTAPTSAAEDQTLLDAATAFRGTQSDPDFAALERFLSLHQNAGWRLAVLTNLGLAYDHAGYISKAVDAFERAWPIAMTVHARPEAALADRALGELLRIHARLGHPERVEALLALVNDRGLTGRATELRDGAKQALWLMKNRPDQAYRCGPAALRILLQAAGVPEQRLTFLDRQGGGAHGLNLGQVASLAQTANTPLRIIYREPGSPIPVPSLVHWKTGHFGTIIHIGDGRYEIVDPSFGRTPRWITRASIDAESSGYFLVPERNSQIGQWRDVPEAEAVRVIGAGYTNNNDPDDTTPDDEAAQGSGDDPQDPGQGPQTPCGMCTYRFTEMTVSLNLNDSPIGYTPPIGKPVRVTFSYNQREAGQPATFSFFNVSPKWTLNWLTYIQDDPTLAGATVSRYVAGGGTVSYTDYNTTTQSFAPDFYDASVLMFNGAAKPVYQRLMRDGSLETYGLSNGSTAYPRLIFLTQVADPAGNVVTLNYDNKFRLISIKDATGRLTTFTYGMAAEPLLITEVTDPFGRSAHLAYDNQNRLSSITDVIGLTSSFTYDSSSLIDALTTAYGTTQFSYGNNGNTLYLQATDPLGNTERLEFNQGTSVPSSDPAVPAGLINPTNNYLNDRDTFYWDKHAYAVAQGNYSMARLRHWAHYAPNGNQTATTSNTLESEKPALESRTWYSYLGQPAGFDSGTYSKPIQEARLLDNGSTQLTQFSYNAQGNLTSSIDPVGRTTLLQYAANGIDATVVQQMVGAAPATIAGYTYNGQHKPLTYTDAAGQTYKYAYNGAGQLTLATDPLGHTTRFNYGPLGDLMSIVNADGKTAASFTYDAYDRVATRTDSEGWTVSYAYDALDRLTQETFPDLTKRTLTYNKLDLASVTDRQGRTTSASYDAVRNLIAVSDPLNETTTFGYYENKKLKTLTDPNGNVTTWSIDVQGRVTGKTYANHLGTATAYEATTSRVHAITDALGQSKIFSYGADNTLAGVTYVNAVNPTPSVSFTYDPSFRRITSMTDGNGTTGYVYEPPGALGALKLAAENPPFSNASIAYQYDALGRVTGRSVGGDVESVGYDKIGRVVSHADDLGRFQMTYLGETSQLTSRRAGLVGTVWTYAGNKNDRRLTAIVNSPVASRFQYTTTPENDITGISEDAGYQVWGYTYDKADRLTDATSSLGGSYGYGYDAASNLGQINTPSGDTTVVSNALNQVVTFGKAAFKYDANGNLIADYARTYQWDAENRLVGIGYPGIAGQATQITYDGISRRTSITDTLTGVSTQTRFGWCGQTLCQGRTSGDLLSKRYLIEGEQGFNGGLGLYYGVDQHGSVYDAINTANGLRLLHNEYDSYGNILSSVGMPSVNTGFRYGGLFYHSLSGLYLANFRTFDPQVGRWTSRDPITEIGGVNLYGYASGSPVFLSDRNGTSTSDDEGGTGSGDSSSDDSDCESGSGGGGGSASAGGSGASATNGNNSGAGSDDGFWPSLLPSPKPFTVRGGIAWFILSPPWLNSSRPNERGPITPKIIGIRGPYLLLNRGSKPSVAPGGGDGTGSDDGFWPTLLPSPVPTTVNLGDPWFVLSPP